MIPIKIQNNTNKNQLVNRSALAILLAIFVGYAEINSAYAFSYSCDETTEDCVINYNKNKKKTNSNSVRKINIVRVVAPGRKNHSMQSILNKTRNMIGFYDTVSRGQFTLKVNNWKTKEVDAKSCQSVKNKARHGEGGPFLTVYSLPKGLCNFSNYTHSAIFLNDNSAQSFAHETGHGIGFGHSSLKNKGKGASEYGDVSSIMGRGPALNYAIPQLHWVGWTKKNEIVKLNGKFNIGEEIEVSLRPLDRNVASDDNTPLAYVYELPSGKRLFISIPRSASSNLNDVKGGEIFVHRANKCVNCSGISMGTMTMARIKPNSTKTHNVLGLSIRLSSTEGDHIIQKGKKRFKYRKVTLLIGFDTESDMMLDNE